MTGRNAPPDLANEISQIKRRLDAIERKLNGRDTVYQPEIVFSYSGPLAAAESPTWTRRETGRLVEVQARLRVVGTTDTVVNVQQNGSTVLVVTIKAGLDVMRKPCSIVFYADQDVLHDVIDTAGAGATDLTLQHRFRG